jgi:Protein of unknown function (DUF4229)
MAHAEGFVMGKEETAPGTLNLVPEAEEQAVDSTPDTDLDAEEDRDEFGDAAFEADESAPPAARSRLSGGSAALRYTTLRLALFLGSLVVIWGIARVFDMDLSSQLSRLTLLAVAVLVSSSASFFLLSRQRDAMSAGLVARSERLSRRFNAASSFEDE